ncbi:hypothetical protein Tco_0467368, partial [Tanacetum coccineum]
VGDDEDEEEDVQEVQRPMGRDISKKKGETSMKSSTSSNEDASARLMPTDHLYGQEVEMALDLKRVIKERWDLTC